MDLICNGFGKRMLHMCKSLGLRILNGRTRGDHSGSITFFSSRGFSVNDYCLINRQYLNDVISFTVCDFNEYSDHAPILVELKCKDDLISKAENGICQCGEIKLKDKKTNVKRQYILKERGKKVLFARYGGSVVNRWSVNQFQMMHYLNPRIPPCWTHRKQVLVHRSLLLKARKVSTEAVHQSIKPRRFERLSCWRFGARQAVDKYLSRHRRIQRDRNMRSSRGGLIDQHGVVPCNMD